MKNKVAYYHLPGLFEFYEFYRLFLPLYKTHRDWFYDFVEIGAIYGAPADCLWGGGRVGFGEDIPKEVFALMEEYEISSRLTFSNSLLEEKHLKDNKCNALCVLFSQGKKVQNGVIVHSDLLLNYLKEKYPSFYFVSSTTKVITDEQMLIKELDREDFQYVVPDFRFNKALGFLQSLSQKEKDKVEFLCNECCYMGCNERKACYENVSRKNLGEDCKDHVCHAPFSMDGYRFSKAMENPCFIGQKDIKNVYLPMGFSQFKIEGRSLGSAILLEFILYYMTKPEYHLKVREALYLDSSLDLF